MQIETCNKIMLFLIIYFFIACLMPVFSKSIIINEIMANPDNDIEWIELYENESDFNLTGLFLHDNNAIDEIICCNFSDECSMIIKKNTYLLIFPDNQEIIDLFSLNESNYTEKQVLCVDDSKIGNGLGNSGDIINITDRDNTFAYASYNKYVSKNTTLSFLDNNSSNYCESPPSPWEKNTCSSVEDKIESKGITISPSFPSVFYCFSDYFNLFRITNEDHETGKSENISVFVMYNISRDDVLIKEENFSVNVNSYTESGTGSAFFNESGNYTICGQIQFSSHQIDFSNYDNVCEYVAVQDPKSINCIVSIKIETEKEIYDNNEKITYKIILSNDSFPFEITYWIEDLFGNYIKHPFSTKSLSLKSYTSSIDESNMVLLLKTNISFIACNDSSSIDNSFEKLVAVRNYINNSPYLKITEIYYGVGDSIKFDDIFEVKIDAFRGNSSKSSISVWVEQGTKKASGVSYSGIYNKYGRAEIKIPIEMKDACTSKLSEGKYTLVVSGFDLEDKKEVDVIFQDSYSCAEKEQAKKTVNENLIRTEVAYVPVQEYNVFGLNKTYGASSPVDYFLLISNTDKINHSYSAWGYIYNGTKCLSGGREDNIVNITLNPKEEKVIPLNNRLIVFTPGDLKLKVKIKKDSAKSEKEFTYNLTFVKDYEKNDNFIGQQSIALEEVSRTEDDTALLGDNSKEKKLNVPFTDTLRNDSSEFSASNGSSNQITGNIVVEYNSSSEKAKKLIPFFLILVLAIISLIIIIKKGKF
ncbi:MAG: hypothetical protein V1859_06590 [archaeon]